MYDITIGKISNNEKKEVEQFLNSFDLSLDDDVEYTYTARYNGEIVGTCSSAGKVIKCFAVKSDLQGEGLSAKLVTHATNELFDKGIYDTFIFTKPSNREIFMGLGYSEVYTEKNVVLLERGITNINKYIKKMFNKAMLGNEAKAGIVMNCNPFTKGHRYLIEKTASENETVVIFVVEEDRSVFPFKIRLELIKKGVEDLKNVYVIAGGEYIISSSTFPSYFLKKEDDRLLAYTRLDVGIFGKYIAPVFNIKKRYIGEEPIDRVTRSYNEAMFEVLPSYGIDVVKLDRLESETTVISASEVRRMIKQDNWDRISELVPKTTLDFLKSEAAAQIIKKIKESEGYH
jgi:[citrate (pro-3S)-lyase] ligase